MREFFIGALDKLVALLVILLAIGVAVGGLVTMFSGNGGFLQGLAIWLFGGIYVLVIGGMLYLFLGIYDNTRRTADAVERMAAK